MCTTEIHEFQLYLVPTETNKRSEKLENEILKCDNQ